MPGLRKHLLPLCDRWTRRELLQIGGLGYCLGLSDHDGPSHPVGDRYREFLFGIDT